MHPQGFSPNDGPHDNTSPVWPHPTLTSRSGARRVPGPLRRLPDPQHLRAGQAEGDLDFTECTSPTALRVTRATSSSGATFSSARGTRRRPEPQVGRPSCTIPVTDPARYTTPGAFCGDWPMFRDRRARTAPRGWGGLHIIDISDPTSPDVIGFVDIPCGSHTETLVPDLANSRLLVYSNASAKTTRVTAPAKTAQCRGIDIIEVPLDDPAGAPYLNFLPRRAGHAGGQAHMIHDSAVSSATLKAGLARGTAEHLDIATRPTAARSRIRSSSTHSRVRPGGPSATRHSAFTGTARYIILGREPGGGGQAPVPGDERRQERARSSTSRAGTKPARFSIRGRRPRLENCTWHNSTSCPRTSATSSWAATTSLASASSTSPTRRTPRKSRTPTRRRCRGSGSAVRRRARRRLVDLLVQRSHLRVRHHARAPHLAAERQGGLQRPEVRPPEPADLGDLLRAQGLTGSAGIRTTTGSGRREGPLPGRPLGPSSFDATRAASGRPRGLTALAGGERMPLLQAEGSRLHQWWWLNSGRAPGWSA